MRYMIPLQGGKPMPAFRTEARPYHNVQPLRATERVDCGPRWNVVGCTRNQRGAIAWVCAEPVAAAANVG